MNRREFLRLGTAAIAAAAVPGIALAKGELRFGRLDNVRFIETPSVEHQGRLFVANGNRVFFSARQNEIDPSPVDPWAIFEPQHEYGNGFHINVMPSPKATETLVETLYEDMVKTVPPGYRDRVSIYGPVAVDFGRAANISWMYKPT